LKEGKKPMDEKLVNMHKKTSQAKLDAMKRYREKGRSVQANVTCTPETLARWDAYAAYKGKPRATMIRDCISRAIAADGWTYSPANAPEHDQPQEDELTPEEVAELQEALEMEQKGQA
jgi:hypothetical protein